MSCKQFFYNSVTKPKISYYPLYIGCILLDRVTIYYLRLISQYSKEARQALDAVFQIITESLKKDEPVAIPGFGKFTVRKRKAMKGRNPSTGDPIDIPNTKLPSLSASRVLKKAFNS